jgi:hypothetical protein
MGPMNRSGGFSTRVEIAHNLIALGQPCHRIVLGRCTTRIGIYVRILGAKQGPKAGDRWRSRRRGIIKWRYRSEQSARRPCQSARV